MKNHVKMYTKKDHKSQPKSKPKSMRKSSRIFIGKKAWIMHGPAECAGPAFYAEPAG